MGIIVNNEQKELMIEDSLIKSLISLVGKVLSAHEKAGAEVGVILTDKNTIRQLNRDYRQVDSVTDVLSFALNEGEKENVAQADFTQVDFTQAHDIMPELLGDVIICIPRAKEQAVEYGHSFEREVMYLAIHGVLHLLGFDHQTDSEQKIMRAEEEKFLVAEGWRRPNG